MIKFKMVLTTITIAMLTILAFSGCTGPDSSIAEISVMDPPAEGTVLPSTIELTLSYSISDEYYDSANTYRVTGYFRASDSYIQAYQSTVTAQSQEGLAVVITDTGTYTTVATIEKPYRLYFQLTDETDGIMVLAESSDVIYQEN